MCVLRRKSTEVHAFGKRCYLARATIDDETRMFVVNDNSPADVCRAVVYSEDFLLWPPLCQLSIVVRTGMCTYRQKYFQYSKIHLRWPLCQFG